ncbi:hypothetical protein C3E97_032605, partial [Pseudomonas sp. MWU12-2115]|uniref:hypothetical protein n=1 Tax=Pseudomonas sp. MWU12-2115 TaxID=2071713 RepID=UPI000DFBDF23
RGAKTVRPLVHDAQTDMALALIRHPRIGKSRAVVTDGQFQVGPLDIVNPDMIGAKRMLAHVG